MATEWSKNVWCTDGNKKSKAKNNSQTRLGSENTQIKGCKCKKVKYTIYIIHQHHNAISFLGSNAAQLKNEIQHKPGGLLFVKMKRGDPVPKLLKGVAILERY